ncbi:MAG: hypothetical protein QHH02_05755 [Syntrophomonadaceae bacterium]|nr:hypothetical protein [Syntrophomonadaceae bacterium]
MKPGRVIETALQLAGLQETPADSGVIVDGQDLRRVMFGIDMETPEIILAKQLGYDGVITHHPKGGKPMLDLHQVMENQIDRMVQAGVPINKAQKALADRREEVERSYHVTNYDRAVAAARLLEMPFVAIHTPADLLGEYIVQSHLDKRLGQVPRATLKDVINCLLEIPEYQNALVKPKIWVGREDSYAGRIWVTMAGGTGGGSKVAQAYFEAGVGTLVVMHMTEEVLRAVKQQGIGNVIVAGHLPSDSIGINCIIKALEKQGMEVTRMAGVVDPKKANPRRVRG